MLNAEDKILKLKELLNEELKKANSDNNIVLSLSHELAKLDENQVRFSVDANLINRLGKELVGRHETAVSELVKNAYDADALEVNLIFEKAWEVGGTLFHVWTLVCVATLSDLTCLISSSCSSVPTFAVSLTSVHGSPQTTLRLAKLVRMDTSRRYPSV